MSKAMWIANLLCRWQCGIVSVVVIMTTAINASGDYKLVADLTALNDCIAIKASNVDLNLNGHTITGPGTSSNASGIHIVSETKIDIKGSGVVTNFAFGVTFEGVDASEVKDVTVTGNLFGFVVNRDFATPDLNNLSEENWFRNNTATGNVLDGFTLNGASNNYFISNTSSNNGGSWIFPLRRHRKSSKGQHNQRKRQ